MLSAIQSSRNECQTHHCHPIANMLEINSQVGVSATFLAFDTKYLVSQFGLYVKKSFDNSRILNITQIQDMPKENCWNRFVKYFVLFENRTKKS
jgi:hypothetical protein